MKTKALRRATLYFLLTGVSILGKAQMNTSDSTNLSNHKEFRQAINFCPVALAFGIYSMNYERLISDHHGVLLRADYEAVPQSYSDANINASGKAGIVNYRYHVKGGLKSCFVGAFSRYRVYDGDGEIDGTSFDFTLSEVTVGANIGKRWILKNGLNCTFAVGYGLLMDNQSTSSSATNVNESIQQFKNEYDLYNGFFGEFSIGYAF